MGETGSNKRVEEEKGGRKALPSGHAVLFGTLVVKFRGMESDPK